MPDIPLGVYQQMTQTGVALARAEAAELLRRGDTAGANRKLDEAIQMATEARVRVEAASQPAAQPPPAPAPAPELSPEQRVQAHIDAALSHIPAHVHGITPPLVRHALIERARQAAGVATDGRFNPAESFGLAPPRPK